METKEVIEQQQYEEMIDFAGKLKAAGLWDHKAFTRIWNTISKEVEQKPAGEGGELFRLSEDLFWAGEATKKKEEKE